MAIANAVILNGASLSGEVDLRNLRLVGIIFPAAWTAADVSFQASAVSGGTFGEVFTDPGSGVGTALLLDAAASQASFFSSKVLTNCFIKVRSGPSGAPVNQGADRALVLLTEAVNVQ